MILKTINFQNIKNKSQLKKNILIPPYINKTQIPITFNQTNNTKKYH